jgi:hypothetical protein
VSCTGLTGVGAFLWELSSLARVARLKVQDDPVRLCRVSGVRSDRRWFVAARVGFSAAFSSRLWWLLVPRTRLQWLCGLGQLG